MNRPIIIKNFSFFLLFNESVDSKPSEWFIHKSERFSYQISNLNYLNFSLFHHTNLSSSEDLEYYRTSRINHFYDTSLCPIWRSKPQSIHLFYFLQKKETKSYKFEITWEWVKGCIYGLTIPITTTLSRPDFKSPLVQFIQWWHPIIPCRPVWYMEKKCTHPSLIKENEKPNNTHYLLWFCWKDSVDEQLGQGEHGKPLSSNDTAICMYRCFQGIILVIDAALNGMEKAKRDGMCKTGQYQREPITIHESIWFTNIKVPNKRFSCL